MKDDEMKETTSEFGEGFVYNLILFAKHWGKIIGDLQMYKQMKSFDEAEAYSMWFYGAGDHMKGFEVPSSLKGTRIDKLSKELSDLVFEKRLAIGENSGTEKDFNKAFELLEELAMEIDRHIGSNPIKAKWN